MATVTDINGEGSEALDPAIQGEHVAILVKVSYPGSRVSDVRIGDMIVQVRNEDLRKAANFHGLVMGQTG